MEDLALLAFLFSQTRRNKGLSILTTQYVLESLGQSHNRSKMSLHHQGDMRKVTALIFNALLEIALTYPILALLAFMMMVGASIKFLDKYFRLLRR